MTPHLSHPKYRPDIDGLRAIAVLAVVVFHAFPDWLKGGFIGVDVFFVISGYLISTIIYENLERGTFSFSEFYARRIKRIFPALILVLIACLSFGWFVLFADEYEQLGKHIGAGAGFISNIVLWNEAGYFDNTADTKPLLHLWSLGIEEQFYIIWPLLLWFSWKRKLNLLTITIIFALTSFTLNLMTITQNPVATFYSPLTRFWELLCGSLLAWVTLYKKNTFLNLRNKINSYLNGEKKGADSKAVSNVLSIFGLLLLAYGFWRINKELSFPGQWALIPVIGTFLLITAGSKAFINRIILSNKVAVWFGLISFPLYLWHWPLLSFARIVEGDVPILNIRITAVVLSILLAWVTYKFVEHPIRIGKHSKVKVTVLVMLMAIVGYGGYYTYKRDGLSSRLDGLTYEKMPIKRKDFNWATTSLAWYKGKSDWLFLGDSHDRTVSKLKLAILPSKNKIEATKEAFSKLAKVGAQFNTEVVLIIGPNKSNIYSEYLPDEIVPSTIKYSSFFLDKLKNVPNLTVYNPRNDLLRLKKTEGILYWMTDTHWNHKGAFLAYSEFSKLFELPIPEVSFQHTTTHKGDLIPISNLIDLPLHPEDNWDVVWKNKPILTEKEIPNEPTTIFGPSSVVINQNPLSNKYVWVVGDSFTRSLRQYFSATFKEVRFVGHWKKKLKNLHEDLAKADKKPDMIIINRVERQF